jgi:hypothetical protein
MELISPYNMYYPLGVRNYLGPSFDQVPAQLALATLANSFKHVVSQVDL